jgi:hypothetical protein
MEIDEYYDLPADDELAAGLDYGEDTERDTIMTNKSPKSKSFRTQNETPGYMLPSSKSKASSKQNNPSPTATNQTGKKKIVPVVKSTKKRFSNASDENIGEAWGEGGFYHDVMSPTLPAKSSQDVQNKNNNNLNQETSNNQYDNFYDNYINNNINSTNNQNIEKISPEFKSPPANLDDNQVTQTKMAWGENGGSLSSTNQTDQEEGAQETSIINHREEQEYMNIQLDREKEFMGVSRLFYYFILFILFYFILFINFFYTTLLFFTKINY